MARDLIPPPSPAGRPQPDGTPQPGRAAAGAAAEPRRPRRRRGTLPAVAVPQPLRLPDRRARRRGRRRRRWSLAVVPRPRRRPGATRGCSPNWSKWQPHGHDRSTAARRRSPTHVGAEYKHPRRQAARRRRRRPLEIQSVPLDVALRPRGPAIIELIERQRRSSTRSTASARTARSTAASRPTDAPPAAAPRGARARAVHVPLPARRRHGRRAAAAAAAGREAGRRDAAPDAPRTPTPTRRRSRALLPPGRPQAAAAGAARHDAPGEGADAGHDRARPRRKTIDTLTLSNLFVARLPADAGPGAYLVLDRPTTG